MKKDIEILGLLLAIVSCGLSAHGRATGNTSSILQTSPSDVYTKTGARVSQRNAIYSGRTSPESLSVVQDWDLVCKQLCGAGLGGQPCDAQCAKISLPQNVMTSFADAILNPNKGAICQDLCTLQLGGKGCDCSQVQRGRTIQTRNLVCNSFCEHNASTLAGCSVCPVDGMRTGSDAGGTLRPVVATTAAVTPDWDALCKNLCKTGDGGALCNCDLPPFF